MDSKRFKHLNYYSREDLIEINEDIEKVLTIPVEFKLEGNHKIYQFEEMREILKEASHIRVQNCGCKIENKNCDAPIEVCLIMDEKADEVIQDKDKTSRLINLDKALEILQKTHEAGLVHLSYIMKGEEKPRIICSCCPCCCHTLGSLVRNLTYAPISPSKFISKTDPENCVNCGSCVQRCVFQARSIEFDSLLYNEKKCFDCGLCVSTCPEQAISLELRNV
ncbi:MAG: 4Fe-4S binding protein [Candidatus Lokiarchaeota archaeon]